MAHACSLGNANQNRPQAPRKMGKTPAKKSNEEEREPKRWRRKTHIQTNKKNESRASQIPNKSSRNIFRPQIRDDKKISNKERAGGTRAQRDWAGRKVLAGKERVSTKSI